MTDSTILGTPACIAQHHAAPSHPPATAPAPVPLSSRWLRRPPKRCKGNRRSPVLFLVLALSTSLFGCREQEPDTYAAAREYFFGVDGGPGHLVSSWTGAYRSKRLDLARAGYGLSEEWQYLNEDLEVKNLGNHEYFFRYSIIFRHPVTGAAAIREESYYSIGDELWEPVPLTVRTYTISANGRAEGAAVTEALWRCDFDGYLEDRDIDCVRRAHRRE
jgi:hypothetical protein